MKSLKVLFGLLLCLSGANVFGADIIVNPRSCFRLDVIVDDHCPTNPCGEQCDYKCDDPFFIPGVSPNCQPWHIGSNPIACHYADNTNRTEGSEYTGPQTVTNHGEADSEIDDNAYQAIYTSSSLCKTLYQCECKQEQPSMWRELTVVGG